MDSRPAQKIVGCIRPCAHSPCGHVEKVKWVRAAVSETSTGKASAVDDGNGQVRGTQQVHREQRAAEPAADDQNVELLVTHWWKLPLMAISIIDIILYGARKGPMRSRQ